MKLIFATGNAGKLREAREILGPHGIEVVSPFDIGLTPEQVEVEETGSTFAENAELKVRHLFELTGQPCFADDSGLEVDALGGAPGIYTARYAAMDGSGADHNFPSNIAKLLHNLQGVTDRSARFVCAVSLALPADCQNTLRSISPERGVYHSGAVYSGSQPKDLSAGMPLAEHFPVQGCEATRSKGPFPAGNVSGIQLFKGTCEGRIALEPAGCGGFGYDPVFIADAFPDRTLAEVEEGAKNAISHRGHALAGMLDYLKA